jgi:hypothetical protein
MPLRRALHTSLPVLAAGLALAACGGGERPGAGLPPGALLVARGAALERLLSAAARLEGTPLARRARALAQRLPDCDWLEARADTAAGLPSRLACGDPAGPLAALHREREAHDLAFALPLADAARLVGAASVASDGSLRAELALPGDAIVGPAQLLLPGGAPAGAPLLSAREALAHARVRSARRLDLAAFVAPDGQASALFRLESELFSGLVLDGTWEAALYPPPAGRAAPRAALALGFRERRAAVAAIDAFIANLSERWPLERRAYVLGGATGACLHDLNVLPDLAPCYVATERALVVGWNPESLRLALGDEGGSAAPAAGLDGPAALVVDLARIEQADARLRALVPAGIALVPQPAFPWRRLELNGASERDVLRLRVRLEAKEGA